MLKLFAIIITLCMGVLQTNTDPSSVTVSPKEWEAIGLQNDTTSTGQLFSWQELYEAGCDRPESCRRLDQKCPHCGGAMYRVYWRSPEWTWKSLCGRAGIVTFCPHCPESIQFRCTIMN